MQNVIRSTEQEVLLERCRCVRLDNIKMNLKERTFYILIWIHPLLPRLLWDCFRHVNKFSAFHRRRSISRQQSLSLRFSDFVP